MAQQQNNQPGRQTDSSVKRPGQLNNQEPRERDTTSQPDRSSQRAQNEAQEKYPEQDI